MKTEARILDYESNVAEDAERVGMTIDESSLSHIMQVLTDLYSDPETAVLREYSTNALDAHVDAGVSRPIEVTLPNPLSPFVRIRDYGTGLDAEDIRNVFSRYGTSTKRDSNDVVGMLGLGCKSALTYADQFTVTGTKDGLTTQVLVSRDEDGSGSMTIVSETRDGREDGTEVTVPAKRGNTFADKAETLFRFWTEGTVLVDGKPPARIDGLWLSDTLVLTDAVDVDTVVMGNVPYPFLEDVDVPSFGSNRWTHNGWTSGRKIVAFVPIGAVAFTPSRESLQSTKRTRETLADVAKDAEALRDAAVVKSVEDAASPTDAIAAYREGLAAGFKGEAKYQGREVRTQLDRTPRDSDGNTRRLSPDMVSNADTFLRFATNGRVKGERYFTVSLLDDAEDVLFFRGFDGAQFTPTKRDKLNKWREDNGIEARQAVLAEDFTKDERFWLDGRTIHEWADVDAIKLPSSARVNVSGKPRGHYDGFQDGQSGTFAADTIDTSRPIYWSHTSASSLWYELRDEIIPVNSGTFVALPGNRIEKFLRDFPSAVRLADAKVKAANDAKDKLDAEDIRAFAFQTHGDADAIRGLDPERLNDPALRDAIVLASRDVRAVSAAVEKYGLSFRAQSIPTPLKGYPLASDTYGARPLRRLAEDFYLYANAAYAAKQKGAE